MAVYLDPLTHPDAWNRLAFPTAKLITPGKCKVGHFTRENEYDVKVGKGTAGATETLKGQPPAKGTITFWAWVPQHFRQWDAILDLLRFNAAKLRALTQGGGATTPTGSKGQSFGNAPTKSAADGSGGSTDTGASQTLPDTAAQKGGTPAAFAAAKTAPALDKSFAIEVFHPALADIEVAYFLPPEKLGSWEEDGDGTALYKRDIEFLEWTQPNGNNIAATPTGAGKTDPGSFQAGAQDPSAADAGTTNAKGAASDAQGAHGL